MRHLMASDERSLRAPEQRGRPKRRDFPFDGVVGESRAIRGAVDYARRLAESPAGSVLIVGAAGTGKSVFARALHYAGPRAHDPMFTLEAGSLSDVMLEAELFGFEAGVFERALQRKRGILELAGSGTVYLAGLADFPQRLQPKLLRALTDRRIRRLGGREEYQVQCSVVVGTNRPLEELVAEGMFRKDLFDVLGQARLSLPSLRDRKADVIPLANHFLTETTNEEGLLPLTLAEDAREELLAYEWPGNVRELRSTMCGAARIARGPLVHAEHLSIQRRETYPILGRNRAYEIAIPEGGSSLRDVEALVLRNTLAMTQGDLAEAARILEIPGVTLVRKMRDAGLGDLIGNGRGAGR